ncbi:MAG: tRNA 4-thiouridine(8) synthase ThiI, partial [Desulfobacterales bacterium]|nr:tRNA 4-thiouridine(8) synthase ThiI [Desulfobacterales bacterium]
AKNASRMTGIPLIIKDITPLYMEMMRAPKAGFGKNMNPCMDCHTLMFEQAGKIMEEEGFDFLFSGEVVGQRPKSQNKNSLRYVEKNSGFDGKILRPLSAKCLPETQVEIDGLVDREQLLDINGRSRKIQMELAKKFKVKNYPSPAGGCLLTDKGFSNRLRDLLYVQKTEEPRLIHLLKNGRHFRLSDQCKVIVGRSKHDNKYIMAQYDPKQDLRFRHASMPGPDVILTGTWTDEDIKTAAMINTAYTKSKPGDEVQVRVIQDDKETLVTVVTRPAADFADLMI